MTWLKNLANGNFPWKKQPAPVVEETFVSCDPTLSVLLPNFNHSEYLRQNIGSIQSQTWKKGELIVVDDCSTDDSRPAISELVD